MHLLVSLYPRIVISLCSCVPTCILASLHPHVLWFMCPHLHPCIIISSGLCMLTCNLVSSHSLILSFMYSVLVGILALSHPHILRFMYSGCLLVSSHYHILISLGSCTLGACWYPRILTSSYSQVHCLRVLVGIPGSLHSHILKFMHSGCLLVSRHLHILRFMYSGCLLVSSLPHTLISLHSCTLGACWYPDILISSGSIVLSCLGNQNQINQWF